MPGRFQASQGILASLMLALGLCFVTPHLPLFDFSLFWKASQNLVSGTNPYALPSYSSFVSPEFRAIIPVGRPLPSLSSPAALGLLWFFGSMTLGAAEKLYLFIMYFAFCWACWLGYEILAQTPFLPPLARIALFVVALPLGAFYQAMLWGSLTVFCLIGICGFWAFAEKEHRFLAGCALALCCVKPHLFILFFLWLGVWSFRTRVFSTFVGLCVGLGATIGNAFYIQPSIFAMYAGVFRGKMHFLDVTNASLGSLLATALGGNHLAVMFLPLAAAVLCLFAFILGKTARHAHVVGILILPWSILAAPYSWGHDYIVCCLMGFLAARCLGYAFRERKPRVTGLMALVLMLAFIIGNLLSPHFMKPSYFVICGLLLCLMSAAILYATSDLKNKRGFSTTGL